MAYAKIKNNSVETYPYDIINLQRDNPNTSFPSDSLSRSDIKTEYGIEEVAVTAQPSSKGYHVSEQTPTLVSGTWTQVWDRSLKNADEVSESEMIDGEIDSEKIHESTVHAGHEGERPVLTTPVHNGTDWVRTYTWRAATWLEARVDEYGPISKQIEYITENGLDAWQTKVQGIKNKYPKS